MKLVEKLIDIIYVHLAVSKILSIVLALYMNENPDEK